jgi:hypothetical protein
VQEELLAVIEGQGLSASSTNLTQLRQAILKMVQAGQKAVVIAGVTFAPAVTSSGMAVYWDTVNSRFDLALADGSAKQAAVGFSDIVNGAVYCFGDTVLFTGLTPGRYYLSGTVAGAITATVPTTNVVSVGVAKSAMEVFVDIDAAGGITQMQADVRYAAIITGMPTGAIISYSGVSAPSGYLVCPIAQTNISRTTYAALFAAIGTTWGAGDGSTTFGMPWFPSDYVETQANANVGSQTVGAVISHSHTLPNSYVTSGNPNITWAAGAGSALGYTPSGTGINATGGSANLAAGVRVLKCVKY